jgi:hypothetical protein
MKQCFGNMCHLQYISAVLASMTTETYAKLIFFSAIYIYDGTASYTVTLKEIPFITANRLLLRSPSERTFILDCFNFENKQLLCLYLLIYLSGEVYLLLGYDAS